MYNKRISRVYLNMKTRCYKPKTCSDCPVVKNDKGILVCRCMKELKAKANNPIEKLQMWQKCPLAWDK